MNKILLFIFYFFLVFVFPIHFFIMGENYGYGIQGFFYRYQIAQQGISFIPITNEIGYVISGLIDGRSAVSIIMWIFGSLIFTLSFIIFLLKYHEISACHYKQISYLMVISVFFLILSSIFQYGFFFMGSAGVSILIGIPILLLFAWILDYYSEI